MLSLALEKAIALEEVLTKKTKIKFSINNGTIWYTTTVESIGEDEISLAFPEMFAAVDIILGDAVKCRFTDDSFEYSFDGEIDFVKVYFPQQIKIKVTSEIERFENTRFSKRADTLFLANIVTEDEQETLHACVREVSNTGLKVISKFLIKADSDVIVHIALPVRNIFDSVVTLEGKVVWSKIKANHIEYGIAITDIEDLHKNRMQQFLNMYAK
ncbi:MAG: PilZ domain-containing protein [Clostridia bacterium]|nr:PilZ domain-containing protein [Clostridia bacterium]